MKIMSLIYQTCKTFVIIGTQMKIYLMKLRGICPSIDSYEKVHKEIVKLANPYEYSPMFSLYDARIEFRLLFMFVDQG